MSIETMEEIADRISKHDTHIGKFLLNIMYKFNLKSQKALALFLNIPKSGISRYVNGLNKPSYDRCLQMQALLRDHGMIVDVYDIRPRV